MNFLEFENTQGITLKYTTATVFDRIVAYIIDAIIIGVTVGLLYLTVGTSNESLYFALMIIPVFFYTLLMEILNDGRSVGKLILGLKVVRVDGRYPSGYDYFMRWIFRFVDIYLTSGTLAALMVSSTPRNQRIGDMLGDTTVIRMRNLRVPLARVLKLSELKTRTPKYPQVVGLSESQVVLIKETLNQKSAYKKEAYDILLHDLSRRVSGYLNIIQAESPKVFLETIIKDYIALTR